MRALHIRVRGQVQGVGFRPFVWQLAQEHGLRGRVLNDPEGVVIEAAGAGLDAFVAALVSRAPPLARVDAVETAACMEDLPDGFVIAPSRGAGAETGVTPDAATCASCAAEVRGSGRWHGYAFTNCTNCGPRFTILKGLPYDRARTTMSAFPMCPACRSEYDDPGDRRFHAQPVACPACGPSLWLETGGRRVEGDPVAEAARRLHAGEIIAVKGLGGFHLACNAADPSALATLRARKHRPRKPFALMASLPMLETIAGLGDAERGLLADPAAPIVLVPSRGRLPDAVAPGLDTLGVMLPHTPLHHLLLDAFGGVLVMTSGNLSGEPQVIANADARARLAALADALLLHDRDIARRLDDSVERATPPMVLRRARGRVPGTSDLPPGLDGPPLIALGGQKKGAICLVKNGHALLGHHLGDLDNAPCLDEFGVAVSDYRTFFDHRPALVAVDAHPDYQATRAGHAMGLPVVEVQHHHAHLAACLAENRWPADAGPVAGIVLDGGGLGPDGSIWGGELLLGSYAGFTRAAHLASVPLPGGDRAAREPWRNLFAQLDHAGLRAIADTLLPGHPLAPLRAAVATGLNAPPASSAGRLFDAFAAALGFTGAQDYEGEAAMWLERLARNGAGAGAYPLTAEAGILDTAPLWHAFAQDRAHGAPAEAMAFRFHAALADGFAGAARALVDEGRAAAVALSGGCFQNVLLLDRTCRALRGLPVLLHRTTPANDGGLALGQAMVALAGAGSATPVEAIRHG